VCHGSSRVHSMGERWATRHRVRAMLRAALDELSHSGAHRQEQGRKAGSGPASWARQQAARETRKGF
jgi:hypothetical protein